MITWAPRTSSFWWLFADREDRAALVLGLLQFCLDDGCGLELN